MTSDRRFEHDLPELLAQLAPRATPEYRDDIVRQTASLGQRPAWMFPERWLPVDLTLSQPRGRLRPRTGFLALALVGLLIAAAVLAFVGSRTPRVPAPFGPADNGALFYSTTNGDIYTADSATATPRLLLGGATVDTGPVPSRDGRHLAFARAVDTSATQIVVMDVDGTNLRVLGGSYHDFREIDWSPDGAQIAIIDGTDGDRVLRVLEADGSASHTLSLGVEPYSFWYLPDGRFVFLGIDRTTGDQLHGIYTANADGSGLKAISPLSPSDSDYIDLGIAPNGRYLVYHRWRDPDQQGRLHVVDLQTLDDRAVLPTGMSPEEEHEGAQFSPDSSLLMYTAYTATDNTLSVVPAAGGPSVDIGEVTQGNTMPVAGFSPDGKSVMAYYPDDHHLWLLDPTGATPGQQLDLPVADAPAWQRAAH